jgi:adenosine deaminase
MTIDLDKSQPPAAHDFATFLTRLPKAELHVHVVGAIRPTTLAELAAHRGVALPRSIETLYQYRNFYDFIELFRLAACSLVTASDFARVAYEYIETGHRVGNLRYVEFFFNPSYHYPHGVTYQTQLAGLVEGITAAQRDFPVSARLIPSIDREFGVAMAERVLDDVLAHPHAYVVGLGIDGPEDKGPPERFAPVFQRAGRAGLKRTAHVCEDYALTPATNYAVCRDVLGCDRLDHGYRLLTDETLCARARQDGITFTCCPKPSTRERDAIRLDAIKHMHAAGLAITLATDDPAMFETDIGEAYRRFFLGAHLGMADARAIALNAVNAAWLDEPHRAQLRQSFEDEIDALTRAFGGK